MAVLVDTYNESNASGSVTISSTPGGEGQSFTGISGILNSAIFYLSKTGTPTGNISAYLFNATGTFGTDETSTGTALATSDGFDVSTLTGSNQLVTFNFTGVNKYPITSTNYVIMLIGTGVTFGGGTINVAVDTTSPTHPGATQAFFSASPSTRQGTTDTIFYVYVDDPTTAVNFTKASTLMVR